MWRSGRVGRERVGQGGEVALCVVDVLVVRG